MIMTVINTHTLMAMHTDGALLHLMHLVSPALPVGAYAYSQGQEAAVEQGVITDVNSAYDWIHSVFAWGLGCLDLPVLVRIFRAWSADDHGCVQQWNDWVLAARETQELWLEDSQMGAALQRLLRSLSVPQAESWDDEQSSAFVTQFALAGVHWQIPLPSLLRGFAFSWLENQVAAATRLIPLGQTQAQQLLLRLMADVGAICDGAAELTDAEIDGGLPGLAMTSTDHETQYSRLFRS